MDIPQSVLDAFKALYPEGNPMTDDALDFRRVPRIRTEQIKQRRDK